MATCSCGSVFSRIDNLKRHQKICSRFNGDNSLIMNSILENTPTPIKFPPDFSSYSQYGNGLGKRCNDGYETDNESNGKRVRLETSNLRMKPNETNVLNNNESDSESGGSQSDNDSQSSIATQSSIGGNTDCFCQKCWNSNSDKEDSQSEETSSQKSAGEDSQSEETSSQKSDGEDSQTEETSSQKSGSVYNQESDESQSSVNSNQSVESDCSCQSCQGKQNKRSLSKFRVGDHVKITSTTWIARKGFNGSFSNEIFILKEIINGRPTFYKLEDLDGEVIKNKFQAFELRSVT